MTALQTSPDLNAPAVRRLGLGASDGAAACGMDPDKPTLRLYLEKTGELPPDEETDAMRIGKIFEAGILEFFSHKTGKPIIDTQVRFRHPSISFLWSTVDGVVSRREIVEAKWQTWTRGDWGQEGTDDVPTRVLIQTQIQLACAEADIAHVPVMLSGRPRFHRVERNDRLFAGIASKLADFWDHVQRRDPPEPDFAHKDTPGLLKSLYGVDGRTVTLGADALQYAALYHQYAEQEREAKKAKEEMQARLAHVLGDAALGVMPGGKPLVTRKQIAYTLEPRPAREVDYIRFDVKNPNGRKSSK